MILPAEITDLPSLPPLQPADWPDIVPNMRFYIDSLYCYPVKYAEDNIIKGIGVYILFGETAWLAHIIVHPEYRHQGIGMMITKHLMDLLKNKVKSILLIATPMGLPVYMKAGFIKDSEYLFFNDGKFNGIHDNSNISVLHQRYIPQILELDADISGEDRSVLIREHLEIGWVYQVNDKVEGYFLPDLKEGLIIAKNDEAGISLMKKKYSTVQNAVIPEQNKSGIEFLQSAGYNFWRVGTRMYIGNRIYWKPENIYGRISGGCG